MEHYGSYFLHNVFMEPDTISVIGKMNRETPILDVILMTLAECGNEFSLTDVTFHMRKDVLLVHT